MSNGGLPIEVQHTGKGMGLLYVLKLEGLIGNPPGGAGHLTTVPNMWYAHACGKYDPEPIDRQV